MTCGSCAVCNSGNEHLCATRELIGMRVPGAFAEQVAINNKNLTEISDNLSSANAALAEPLACAVNAVNQAARHSGEKDASIVVLGGGAIGLLAALVFSTYGYSNIQIAETNPVRRKLLERLGNFNPYDPLTTRPADASIDIVLDAVGSGITRQASSAMVCPGGVIVHIGLQTQNPDLIRDASHYRKSAFPGFIAIVTVNLPKPSHCWKAAPYVAGAGPKSGRLMRGPEPLRTFTMAQLRQNHPANKQLGGQKSPPKPI